MTGEPPLLAVDGDSFAHRAYHALPKSIRRAEGRPAGAIVGFANMLVRLWEAEQPRTVLVAGKEGLVSALRDHFSGGPAMLKPNRGGKGLGVRLFHSADALAGYVDGPEYEAPVEASEDTRETTERLMAEIRRLYETL